MIPRLAYLCATLVSIVAATSLIQPISDQDTPFPCKLQHGCVCNHTGTIVKNIYDGQFYAPCIECDAGWTGPLCNVLDTPCMNGGATYNSSQATTPCVCPTAWSGQSCEDMQCPNSINGHGAYHVVPVDAVRHDCDECLAGWQGIQCGVCQDNSVCGAYAGASSVCDSSLIARGAEKHLECEVSNPRFLKLLGHNVEGRVTMDCRGSGGTASLAASGSNVECSVAFFRIEENASFVDPFFYCTARNCSMEVSMQKDEAGESAPGSTTLEAVRAVGQAALLLECLLLAILGQAARMLPKRTVGRALLGASALLVATLVVYMLLMVVIMNHNRAPPRSIVAYRCDAAHCVCAPDPPSRYTPVCSTSVFGTHILPIIANGMDLTCHTDDQQCVFSPRDVPTRVDLSCKASECVNTDTYPDAPTIGSSNGNSQQKNLLVISISIGFVVLGVVGLHLHVTFQRTWASASEFVDLFLTEASRRRRRKHQHLTDEPHDAELRTVAEDCDDESSDPDDSERSGAADAVASPTVQVYEPVAATDTDEEEDAAAESRPLRRRHDVGDSSGSAICRLHRADVHSVMSAPICLELRRLSYQLRSPSCSQTLKGALNAMSRRGEDNEASVPRSHLHNMNDDDGDGWDDHGNGPRVKQILNDVTFSVWSGQVLALMGPSGAGKTTLLDLLAMRLKSGDSSGTLAVNGVSISTKELKQQYRAMVGYVSQEDTLLPSLTVRETVHYAARLKLPTSFSHSTIDHIVSSVLCSLRLDRCEGTLVGDGSGIRGVSGGERRRVSIAVELVANPRILFLDEPTSGLDAVSARVVMEAVAQLARSPPMQQYAPHFFAFAPIVVFSIHQPSREIYDLFDKVLLLSRGVAVYYGVAVEAVPFLAERLLRSPPSGMDGRGETVAGDDALFPADDSTQRRKFHPPPHENPADTLMKLEDRIEEPLRDNLRAERAVTGLATHDGYLSVTPVRDMEIGRRVLALTVASRKYYPNTWQQMSLLSQRSLSALLGSFELIVCHSLVTFFVGALMCILYEHEALDLPGSLNRAGSITFLLLVVAFVSLSGLDPLLSERKLLVVERENGYYGTLPYLLTKLLVDVVPLRVVSVAVLGAVIYFPMGLRTDDGVHFLWFVSLLCLFSVCMTFMTFAVGIMLGSFGPAALTSSIVILWNFVFGGLLVQADTIPYVLAPFRRVSPFFLTFESLLVNELNGQLCTFAPTDATGKPSASAIPLLCVQYLENLGLHPSRFGGDVVLLGVLTVGLLFVVYILLNGIRSIR